MAYFYVRVSSTVNEDFVVQAADRDAAQAAALDVAYNETTNKNVLRTMTNSTANIDITDADRAAWTDAVKRNKAK
jgi:leucyl aminopeptidase (aminopeptidase T)